MNEYFKYVGLLLIAIAGLNSPVYAWRELFNGVLIIIGMAIWIKL